MTVAKILIVGTFRYSINACDFDLMFRNSEHEVVKVLYHHTNARKRWFKTGKHCPGNRNKISTKLTDHPNEQWIKNDDLGKKMDRLDWDYVCFGNGTDPAAKWTRNRYGDSKKYLYSEYGWFPWNESFYIDTQGGGANSSIRHSRMEELRGAPDRPEEIAYIQRKLNVGKTIQAKDFIYIPLQVDTPTSDGKPDFKFRFTPFKNNNEFLKFIQGVIPSGTMVFIKNHPAASKPTRIPAGMLDISKKGMNKLELYKRMKAMVAINSTSVLEALLMGKNVFTYGDDIFSNKGLTHQHIRNRDQFASLLNTEPSKDIRPFINCLLERQVYRHRCNDPEYIKNHYWNRSI